MEQTNCRRTIGEACRVCLYGTYLIFRFSCALHSLPARFLGIPTPADLRNWLYCCCSSVITTVVDIADVFDHFKTAFEKRAAKKIAKKAAEETLESSADDILKAVGDIPPDGLMKTAADGLDDALKALHEGEMPLMLGEGGTKHQKSFSKTREIADKNPDLLKHQK